MSRLRLVPYRDLAKVAERARFHWARRAESHNTFVGPDGMIVVIPDHGSLVIVRPLLRKIIRDLGLTPDEYTRILEDL